MQNRFEGRLAALDRGYRQLVVFRCNSTLSLIVYFFANKASYYNSIELFVR